jgi:FG-GAP repeat
MLLTYLLQGACMRIGMVGFSLAFASLVLGAVVACGRVAAPAHVEDAPRGPLGTLTVSNGTLTPAFDPTVTDYVIANPTSDGWDGATTLVTATAADPAATIAIDDRAGDVPVSVHMLPGQRSFTVVVSSPDGSHVTYTLRAAVAPTEVATIPSPPIADDYRHLAFAISGDGNTMVRAEVTDKLTVYTGGGDTWTEQATLSAPTGLAFGGVLALSRTGDTLAIAVGTPRQNTTPGVVVVFDRTGTTWSLPATVAPAQALPYDAGFGSAVAFTGDGNTLAVGAPNDASGSDYTGSAHIFSRAGGQWQETSVLRSPNAVAPGQSGAFGQALAFSGDGATLVVGAPLDGSRAAGVNPPAPDAALAYHAGAAFVYARGGTGWSQVAYVKASNTLTGETNPVGWKGGTGDPTLDKMSGGLFGTAVALSQDGQVLAVGAPYENSSATAIDGAQDNRDASLSGAVYLFGAQNGAWSQLAYVKASNTQFGGDHANFGMGVALSDDGSVLAVTSPGEASAATGVNPPPPAENDVGTPAAGAAYMFTRWQGAWGQRAYVKPAQRIDGSFTGYGGLALTGDGRTLLVGEGPRGLFSAPGVAPVPAQTILHVFH